MITHKTTLRSILIHLYATAASAWSHTVSENRKSPVFFLSRGSMDWVERRNTKRQSPRAGIYCGTTECRSMIVSTASKSQHRHRTVNSQHTAKTPDIHTPHHTDVSNSGRHCSSKRRPVNPMHQATLHCLTPPPTLVPHWVVRCTQRRPRPPAPPI